MDQPAMVQGAMKLFRFSGITVYLHWTWFLLAYFLVQIPRGYTAAAWNAVEVVGIFGIVLLHEFGHALACRQTGGRAETIMLWPLGGIAYVQPPMRPGAVLWSLAAGPLVNVALVPVTYGLLAWAATALPAGSDALNFAAWLFRFNLIILIFNLLPIYPLDGGQILHGLLWYVMGFARSLRLVTGFGLLAATAGGVWALTQGHIWLIVLAVFAGTQAWSGWRRAQYLLERGVP